MKPTTPGSHQKKSTKIGQPYICQRTKECFDLSIKANLRVFQYHRKQAKDNVVFHCFPSNHHDFEFLKSVIICP